MSTTTSGASPTPRVTPSVVRRWIDQQDMTALNAWLRTGERSQKLATEAWTQALQTGWTSGLQRVWDAAWVPPLRLLTLAWNHRQSAPPPPALEAWLDGRTWGPPDDAAHARAQKAVRILALLAAPTPARWETVWQNGVPVNNPNAGQLLCSLMQQRFNLFQVPSAGAPLPDLVFLDRWIDRLATAGAPLNAHHLTALLGACVLPPTPAQHALLDRLLDRPAPGIAPALLTRMLCEMTLVAQRLSLDPAFMARLHERVLAWGAPPAITVPVEDLVPWGPWGPDGRVSVTVQGVKILATQVRALALSADPGKNRPQEVLLADHWSHLKRG